LQGIHKKEPDLLASAVAKSVHDSLNTIPVGIPVINAKGDRWNLSGDGTLNTKSKEIGRRAVAQSQLNVLGGFKSVEPLNLPSLFKEAWDYVPWPTDAGEEVVKPKVESSTDPKEVALITAVANLINTNYLLILKELVARSILKKA
jgi:hypothetical protein